MEKLYSNIFTLFIAFNLLVFLMKPDYFEEVYSTQSGAAEYMTIRTAQKFSYGRSARVIAVPILLVFCSVPFYQVLEQMFATLVLATILCQLWIIGSYNAVGFHRRRLKHLPHRTQQTDVKKKKNFNPIILVFTSRVTSLNAIKRLGRLRMPHPSFRGFECSLNTFLLIIPARFKSALLFRNNPDKKVSVTFLHLCFFLFCSVRYCVSWP